MPVYGGAAQPKQVELNGLLVDKMSKSDNEDCTDSREQLFATWNKGCGQTWMSNNEMEEEKPRGKKHEKHNNGRHKRRQ